MKVCKHCGDPLSEGKRPHAESCDSTCRARNSEQALKSARKPLTQRDRVLFALRDAGAHGLRSDVFLKLAIPRYAARIWELKRDGYKITSEPEQQFCRYTLVGSSASPSAGPLAGATSGESNPLVGSCDAGPPWVADAGIAGSGEAADDEPAPALAPPTPSAPARSIPSMFDADDCVDWGRAA